LCKNAKARSVKAGEHNECTKLLDAELEKPRGNLLGQQTSAKRPKNTDENLGAALAETRLTKTPKFSS